MLNVTRSILVSAPRERVSEYLRDICRLPDYEQKVDRCTVSYPEPETAVAEVSGRYFGLPWTGSYRVVYTQDGGYQSEMLRGPFRRSTGGFTLRTVAGGTWLTHQEEYQLPYTLRILRPLVSRWLNRTVELELGVIKEEAERLHRRHVVENVDKDVQL